MGKNAFIAASNGRLRSWGFTERNGDTDIVIPVEDGFDLDPDDGWRWDGSAWQPFPFPPVPPSELAQALDNALADMVPAGPKLKAVLAALRKVTR
jgi:hypothetical protein